MLEHLELRTSRGVIVERFSDLRQVRTWLTVQNAVNPERLKTLTLVRVTTILKEEELCLKSCFSTI